MSLGLVSPILNRGVRSRWVSTLPASSKMLTIDAAGDVSYTDVPTASWGSITGTLSSQTDLQNALNAKLSLSGGTMTGAITSNTGTVTTSTPVIDITQTWNSGSTTFDLLTANVTRTAYGAASRLIRLRVDSAERFYVTSLGDAYFLGNISCGSLGTSASISAGSVVVTGASNGFAANGSAYIQLSDGTSASLMRADGGGYNVAFRNGTNPHSIRIYNTFTDASNYERGKIEWSSNVLRIGTEKAGTGSARAVEIQTDGTTRLTIASASPTVTIGTAVGTGILQFGVNTNGDLKVSSASLSQLSINQRGEFGVSSSVDGQWRIGGWNATNPILCFQGITSSFPAIKRNGTAINFRLADDSADAGITASTATFSGNVTVSAVNIVTDTTTGTKIGTATTQKIGFYNKTPIVQPAAVADATDAASVITQLNLLLSRMRDLGLIAT